MAWKHDDAIGLRCHGGFEGFFLALSQAGKRSELNIRSVYAKGCSFLLDAPADFVPERTRAFQGVNGDAKFLLFREQAGGHVGPVAHVLRHLQNTRPGHGIHARMVMQSPVHRAGGYAQRVSDVKQGDSAAHGDRFRTRLSRIAGGGCNEQPLFGLWGWARNRQVLRSSVNDCGGYFRSEREGEQGNCRELAAVHVGS